MQIYENFNRYSFKGHPLKKDFHYLVMLRFDIGYKKKPIIFTNKFIKEFRNFNLQIHIKIFLNEKQNLLEIKVMLLN